MNNNKDVKVKYVFNSSLANYLCRSGNDILSAVPNYNKDAKITAIFCFADTEKLNNDISNYRK